MKKWKGTSIMVGVVLDCDREDYIKIEYTFEILFKIAGLKYSLYNRNNFNKSDVVIYYGKPQENSNLINIPYYKNLAKNIGKKGNSPPEISGFFNWNKTRLPFWYNYIDMEVDESNKLGKLLAEDGSCIVARSDNCLKFGFDLIMSAFHLLSCQEEYLISKRDKHNRFLGQFSPRDGHNLLEVPIVNFYSSIIYEYIISLSGSHSNNRSKKNLHVLLSHDIDNISYNFWLILAKIFNVFKSPSLDKFFFIFKLFNLNRIQFIYFNKYIEIEKKYNAKSVFFFIGGKKGRYGARYDWRDIESAFVALVQNKFDIGYHTNYYYYNNPSQLVKHKEILEQLTKRKIFGNRNHYLRFITPDTFHTLKDAGIYYDSTLGYPDRLGFRSGIAFPYKPFDLKKNEVIDIIEIPLTIMDTTVFQGKDYNKEEILRKSKSIIDTAAKVNGYVTLNWHYPLPSDEEFGISQEIYEYLLDYVTKINGRFITEGNLLETEY